MDHSQVESSRSQLNVEESIVHLAENKREEEEEEKGEKKMREIRVIIYVSSSSSCQTQLMQTDWRNTKGQGKCTAYHRHSS